MKRLVMAVAALAMSVTMGFAQNANTGKKPFDIQFNQLSTYLNLQAYQMNEVDQINDLFINMQQESLQQTNPARQGKKMQQAVYSNLKRMKHALNADQYRKYVALLNITNNNQNFPVGGILADSFLADNH